MIFRRLQAHDLSINFKLKVERSHCPQSNICEGTFLGLWPFIAYWLSLCDGLELMKFKTVAKKIKKIVMIL